jgi:hypothetical protein
MIDIPTSIIRNAVGYQSNQKPISGEVFEDNRWFDMKWN